MDALMPTLRRGLIALFLVGASSLSGCAHYVTVERPPIANAKGYRAVGLIEFTVTEEYHLAPEVTRRFQATVMSSQPGVRILELGKLEDVLKRIGHSTLDPAALAAIGKTYNVDALLTGEMQVSKAKPHVQMNDLRLGRINASVEVKGNLDAKLRETATGVTVWSNGAYGTWQLGGMGVGGGGGLRAGVSDPIRKYDEMLNDLIRVATQDFRPTYVRQRVEDG